MNGTKRTEAGCGAVPIHRQFTARAADEFLDPDLRKQAGGLDSAERLKLAQMFDRWAGQLRLSAAMIDSANN